MRLIICLSALCVLASAYQGERRRLPAKTKEEVKAEVAKAKKEAEAKVAAEGTYVVTGVHAESVKAEDKGKASVGTYKYDAATSTDKKKVFMLDKSGTPDKDQVITVIIKADEDKIEKIMHSVLTEFKMTTDYNGAKGLVGELKGKDADQKDVVVIKIDFAPGGGSGVWCLGMGMLGWGIIAVVVVGLLFVVFMMMGGDDKDTEGEDVEAGKGKAKAGKKDADDK